MAIRRNKRVHEFSWEFDRLSSEQSELSLDVVYHETDEYGPTVSIVLDENGEAFSLPVAFLSEVQAEIDLEEGRRQPSQRANASVKRGIVKIGDAGIKLPSIKRDEAEEISVESDSVVERRDPSLIDESHPPAVSFSKRPTKVEPTAEEQNEIMQRAGTQEERLASRGGVKNPKASIRRAADDGE